MADTDLDKANMFVAYAQRELIQTDNEVQKKELLKMAKVMDLLTVQIEQTEMNTELLESQKRINAVMEQVRLGQMTLTDEQIKLVQEQISQMTVGTRIMEINEGWLKTEKGVGMATQILNTIMGGLNTASGGKGYGFGMGGF